MSIKRKNKHLKAFTIAEILITLVLTSIAITFSYSTLTYTQKLYQSFKQQNKFINQYTDFNQRLNLDFLKSELIIEESENRFKIKRDTIISYLELRDKALLMRKGARCDTFNIVAKNIKKEYELIKNPDWTGKLIKTLYFEVDFTKQKFNFYFYKNYDASVKLELNKED